MNFFCQQDESTRLRDSLKGNINHHAGGHHDLPSPCSGQLKSRAPAGNHFRVIALVTRHSLTVNNGENGVRASRTSGWNSSDFPLVKELGRG